MTDFSEAKGKICFFIYIKFYSLDILNISIITLAYIYNPLKMSINTIAVVFLF